MKNAEKTAAVDFCGKISYNYIEVNEMLLRYEETINLRANDFSCDHAAKVSAILDLMQTVAQNHSRSLNMGEEELRKRDILWVLAKMRITVVGKFPYCGTVKAVTIPQPKTKTSYVRDYYVYDVNGGLLAKGSSVWCLVNAETRRLMPAIIEYVGEYVGTKAYDDNFALIPSVEFDAPSYSCYVQNSEVDVNGHLNNTRYADYILNSFPGPVPFSGFEISYAKEAVKGDRIDIGLKEYDGYWLASGKVNGDACFRAKLLK